MRNDRARDSRRRRLDMRIRATQSAILLILTVVLVEDHHGVWAAVFLALAAYVIVAGTTRVGFGRSRPGTVSDDGDGDANG